jgi:hypothetical protein
MSQSLAAAFIASDGGNNVLVCSSSDPVATTHWSADTDIHQASNGSSPSLAVFDNKLWIAFIANNDGKNVLVCSSNDGINWSANTDIHQASNGSSPSLAVFDNKLWIAFIANNDGKNVLVCSSNDGINWSANTDIHQASNGSAPSITRFNDKLWIAFVANNGGNNLLVCSSTNGLNWSANTDLQQASNGSSPAIAGFDGKLWIAFVANSWSEYAAIQGIPSSWQEFILLCSSTDGVHWPANTNILQSSPVAVSLTQFDNFTFLPGGPWPTGQVPQTAPPGPTLTATNRGGDEFAVKGSGFAPGAHVTLQVAANPSGMFSPDMPSATVGSGGQFVESISCAGLCNEVGGGQLQFTAIVNGSADAYTTANC